jgi:hypothetical protein
MPQRPGDRSLQCCRPAGTDGASQAMLLPENLPRLELGGVRAPFGVDLRRVDQQRPTEAFAGGPEARSRPVSSSSASSARAARSSPRAATPRAPRPPPPRSAHSRGWTSIPSLQQRDEQGFTAVLQRRGHPEDLLPSRMTPPRAPDGRPGDQRGEARAPRIVEQQHFVADEDLPDLRQAIGRHGGENLPSDSSATFTAQPRQPRGGRCGVRARAGPSPNWPVRTSCVHRGGTMQAEARSNRRPVTPQGGDSSAPG